MLAALQTLHIHCAKLLATWCTGCGYPSRLSVPCFTRGLSQVLAECPAARRPDLVFCQNGMLLPLLEEHGLAANTAALLYLSASANGSYTDGRQTVVCGRCSRAGGRARPRMRAALGKCCSHSRPALTHLRCTPCTPITCCCPPRCRWAGAFAALLHRGGVECRVVERGEFLALMIEKLLCE